VANKSLSVRVHQPTGHGESPVSKNPRGEEEKEIGIDELSSK
jgi:hypothetical protein